MKNDVRVVLGSESDAGQANKALAVLKKAGVSYSVSIASCHRNIGGEFEKLAKDIEEPVVLMIGGMSFAAPGIMSSLLRNASKFSNVIIAVPLDEAARSAIEDLPKGTVVLTCGLNRVSVGHGIENAAMAAAQLTAMFHRKTSDYSDYVKTIAKPLVEEVALDSQGQIKL